MSVGRDEYRFDGSYTPVAALVRSVPVRLIEVSWGGCRFESSSRIESGTSGQLAVELQGLMRIDDVRVARCQQRVGAGAVFQVGAELLRTRRLGRRTVRMAVRKLISETRGKEEGKQRDGRAPPRGGQQLSGMTSGRAPRKH